MLTQRVARGLLGTHLRQSALLVMGQPACFLHSWLVRNGLSLFPSQILIWLTILTRIVFDIVSQSQGKGGVRVNLQSLGFDQTQFKNRWVILFVI